jgi:cardiolipin synthase
MPWYAVAAIEGAWLVFVCVWMVLQRRSPAATLSWILALALLPVVGLIVYFFLGPRRLRRRKIRRSMARQAISRWTEGKGLEAMGPPEPEDPRHRRIVEVGVRCGEAPPTPAIEVRLLFDGDECYEALLDAVAEAEHHIHLEFYIVEPGAVQRRVFDSLAAKAREGVEVRLLMDGFGSSGMKSRNRKPLVEAGAEVRFYNSMRLSRLKPRLANFRTHRKIAVVDGKTALTGGMNIADEHSREISGDDAWRDCHLLLRGAAALPLQFLFLEDWHYATGSAPEGPEYLPRPDGSAGGTLVQVLGSGPDAEAYAIHGAFFAALGQARERVLATTAYFVPDEAILAAFTGAARRGVMVKLLVPRKTDTFLVGAAAKTYYEDLLTAGVEVYEYGPGMMHAKTMVIDDDVSIVGSANLDNRSFRLNFEVAAVILGREHAAALAERFDADLVSAEEVTSRRFRDLPLRTRLVEGAARLFSPVL